MSDSRNQHKAKLKLGVLQAGRVPEEMAEDHADYNLQFENLLGKNEFEYHHWAVLDGEFPDSIEGMDAWLITGSRHGAYEDHDWIPPLENLIRSVYAADKPMVGICFGHQIIAQALGGKVVKFEGGWSVGRVEYTLDESVFGATPGTPNDKTALLAFHQDQVIEAPESSRTVGSTSFCQHAALLYGNRMLTIQPHPEFTSNFVDDLLEARGSILPEEIKTNAEEQLHKPIVREPIAQTLRAFLQRENVG